MTRLQPPTGAWTVRSWWFNLPNEGVADSDGFTVIEEPYPTWEPARSHALHLTPCRGAVAVVVHDPFGDVVADWDRFSNFWRHLPAYLARSTQAAWEEDAADRRPKDHSPAGDPAIDQASASPIEYGSAASPLSDQASAQPIVSTEEGR